MYKPTPQKKKRYDHFLLTQFNLKNFPKGKLDDEKSWINWTRDRIGIFKRYCLPSVLRQTTKSFTWILYFDEDTPQEFTPFLNELREIPFVKLAFCKGMDDFQENHMQAVRQLANKDMPYLLTSRMDNDDALHQDAIRTIQGHFRAKPGYLISLSSGYVLNPDDMILSHYFYPMSPFISLVEKNNDRIKGIFQKGHTRWNELRLFALKEIWHEYFTPGKRKAYFEVDRPLWMQVVHGDNVSNSFYRGFPVLKETDLHDFGITEKSRPGPIESLPKYYHYVFWKRYLKSSIVKLAKRRTPRNG